MRALVAMLFLTTGLTIRPVAAQWRVGLELATIRYGGSARDTSGTPNVRPGDATTLGLRLERGFGKWSGALKVSYGKPGLSFSGEGLTVTDKTSGELIEAAALWGVHLSRVGGGPSGAIRAELGPTLHLWKFGDEIRLRAGAQAAVAYEWPIAGRFAGALRVEGLLSPSWFDAADLPPDYERRLTWRYGVALGLRYRL